MMMQTPYLLHALCFVLGFWWICHQKQVEFSQILRSLLGGLILGAASLYALSFQAHEPFASRLHLLPVMTIGLATLVLWLQAREQLGQKMDQDAVYLLTLTFIYFFSPLQGVYRQVGLISALPCALVLLYCWFGKPLGTGGRVGLMFWAMIVSVIIGVQQMLASPDALYPPKALAAGFSSGSYLLSTALQAASFVMLAFNLLPVFEWCRELFGGVSYSTNQEVLSNSWSLKKAFFLTLFHGLPILMNWRYHFISYEWMMSYALVWSPILSSSMVEALFPTPKDETPEWMRKSSQAS